MRKSTLYAGRVLGDIAPGLEPTRLGGDSAKAWARMDFPGMMRPGQTDQCIYEKSATQKFEIGTKRVEYGRTFRYSKAGRAITTWGIMSGLLANAGYVPDAASHEDEDGFIGNPKANVDVDDLYIDLDTDVEFAAHFFQGGYLFDSGTHDHLHYIVDSDLGDGSSCRVYLDHPVVQAILTGGTVEVYPSPYSNVIDTYPPAGYGSYVSFIGFMHCPALETNDFFWLQTLGPCWIQPTHWDSNFCPGYAANLRDVYASSDGHVRSALGHDPSDGFQRIGYLISATEGGYGGAFIMLQLE